MKLVLLLVAAVALAQEPQTRVLIAFHSETGNTEKLARAVHAGAASVGGVAAVLRKAADVSDDEILSADGLIVGTPVQWANLTGETKRLLDRVGAVLWRAKKTGDGRTGGAFCTGGGVAMGKDTARWSILSALLTMRFVVVGGVDAAGFGTLGAEATTGPDDPGISAKEEKEARQFGERFARTTKQMRSQVIR
jgi:NAD(P)H dehydrogenase (quinone)